MTRKTNSCKRAKVPDEVRYAYETARRQTGEGLACEALRGDRSAIRELADLGRVILEGAEAGKSPASTKCRDAAGWLAFILGQIAEGKEPNLAFGWSLSNGGRDKAYLTVERKALLLRDARVLADWLYKKTPEASKRELAEQWQRTDEQVAEILATAPPKKAFTKDVARIIAAEIVAKWHPVNDPAYPWGRYSDMAYKACAAATLADGIKRTKLR